MSEYQETIFSKIIAGEIPCHKLYEDEHVLSFLDIGPLSEGHTLVIPKENARYLHELSEPAAAALGAVLPRLCRAVLKVSGAESYNVLVNTGEPAGQVVMHVHVHIIPQFPDSGLKKSWKAGSLDDATAQRLSKQICAHLDE